jgi:hypothetical protein
VLVSGEPGIGKSRLSAALSQRIQGDPHIRLRYFCSPYHQDSALYPVIAQLERAAGFARDDTCAPGKKFKRRSASFPGPSSPSFPPGVIAGAVMTAENQVRCRLAAGGRWIRTFGSPTDPLPLREQSASHDGLTVSRPGTEISNPSPSSGESVANSNLSAVHANVLAARDRAIRSPPHMTPIRRDRSPCSCRQRRPVTAHTLSGHLMSEAQPCRRTTVTQTRRGSLLSRCERSSRSVLSGSPPWGCPRWMKKPSSLDRFG